MSARMEASADAGRPEEELFSIDDQRPYFQGRAWIKLTRPDS
jgi:hypothetical protein